MWACTLGVARSTRALRAVIVGVATALGGMSATATVAGQTVDRPPQITDSLIARGRVVFSGTARCASCHGSVGQGSAHAPSLRDAKWIRGTGTYEEIVARVVHGVSRRESRSGTPMPMRGWTPASDADVTAVAAYVWSLSHRAATNDLFMTNARIVDPRTETIRHGSILVLDGVVAGHSAEAPPEFAGRRLDVGGQWVIPGLTDLHTHSYGNMAPGDAFDGPGTAQVAKRMLYAGVTAFLDLFGVEDAMFTLRARQRAGGIGGADLFAAGSCLTATEGHCTEYGIPTRVMDSPDDARKQVNELAAKRPDVVKIVYSPRGRMPSIDEETLRAATQTARANGIKTVIHINTWDDVREAVLGGASAVTHIPGNHPVPPELPALMAGRGVAIIPTLAVETDMADFITDPTVLTSPLATALTSVAILDAYRSDSIRHHAAEWAERAARQKETIFASLRKLAEAGVTVLTGTDAGNYGTIQGFSVHRELEKLVQAGFTPWQALRASTTDAGAFLERAFGVQVGDEANFVVLEASPVESIRNTQRIAAVVHHGVVIDRDSLLAR